MISAKHRATIFLIILVALPSSRGAADSNAPSRAGLCECFRICPAPWAVRDRWDDFSGPPSYPEWAGNGVYDFERFDDLNDDSIWQPGEPYSDTNENRIFDLELYNPLITGYTPSTDLGRTIRVGGRLENLPGGTIQGDVVDLPSTGAYGGARLYRENIVGCDAEFISPGRKIRIRNGSFGNATESAVLEVINRDPGAFLDSLTSTVQGSAYQVSPRERIIYFYDPRFSEIDSQMIIRITKLGAIFVDGVEPTGSARLILIKLRNVAPSQPEYNTGWFTPGVLISIRGVSFPGSPSGDPLFSSTTSTSWGRIKARTR